MTHCRTKAKAHTQSDCWHCKLFFSPFPETFLVKNSMLAIKNGVLELQNFNLTCRILAMNIFDQSHITTGGTPLKFVYTGNMTSADRLTFCQPIRNAVCLVHFLDAVSRISRGWLQAVFLTAFSPCPSSCPIIFFFDPVVRFCAAVTLT